MTRAKRTSTPAPTVEQLSQHRRDSELEAWICSKLKLRDLFAGVTTPEIRRDRLKVVLLKRGLLGSVAGRFNGASVSWRALYAKLYGEELTT